MRLPTIQFSQGITPDIVPAHRTMDGATLAFRQPDVIPRGLDERFEQFRLTWMRQDLVDAAAAHDIASQEQSYR